MNSKRLPVLCLSVVVVVNVVTTGTGPVPRAGTGLLPTERVPTRYRTRPNERCFLLLT